MTAAAPLAGVVAWLSTPAAYPGAPAAVERVETHFAWVFLAGDRAYKLKKSIRIHGTDLRLLTERERCCREELRLNSRLAGETYRAVVPVVVRDGALAIGGDGEVVDWLVAMRRLDHAQMLDRRLRCGTVGAAELRAVVECVLRLGHAPAAVPPTARLACEHLARRVEEALRECARAEFAAPPALLAAIDRGLRRAVALCEDELVRRSARARDGHGDLRCEHVWLGAHVQIIDALEFDPALRLLEPVEELAMLAVDAEHVGAGWVGATLREAYAALTGDVVSDELWRFLLGLRAATRAKVAFWHLDDPALCAESLRAHWRARGLEYLELASGHLAGAAP